MPSSKPVIFFDPKYSQEPVMGQCCHVTLTSKHPKLPHTDYVITSGVKFIYKDGSFRTHNSIYKPEPSNDE